jgi:hypothetical protein
MQFDYSWLLTEKQLKEMLETIDKAKDEYLIGWLQAIKRQIEKMNDLLNKAEGIKKEELEEWKNTWNKKIERHKEVDKQIRDALRQRGLTDEKINKDVMLVEIALEKMKEDYKKDKKEGLSDQDAKLNAEGTYSAMKTMMDEDKDENKKTARRGSMKPWETIKEGELTIQGKMRADLDPNGDVLYEFDVWRDKEKLTTLRLDFHADIDKGTFFLEEDNGDKHVTIDQFKEDLGYDKIKERALNYVRNHYRQ